MRHVCVQLLLVLLTGVVARPHYAVRAQGDLAVFEAPSAEAIERGKLALDKWAAQADTERGLLNTLLGNSCFTTAITALNRECSKLSNDQRCWLAIQFSVCFQRASGFKVLDCPTVCPRWRSLQSCVADCTARMDDRQQMTYVQFFGDVLNMCLFLQTQNFQQITAALVADMHASSAAANTSLVKIRSDLKTQAQAVAQSLTALNQLQQVQVEVHSAVHQGLKEVEAIGELSRGLQQSMRRSLNMTEALGSRHEQLMLGLAELDAAHEQHAARARQAFTQLEQEAAALERRQARYEQLQSQLLNTSEGLLSQTQGMSELLQLLIHYQAKGHTILTQLQGRSVTMSDVLFYTLSLSIPLVFITHPYELRLLLLAGLLSCWAAERFVVQQYGRLLGSMQHSSAGASLPFHSFTRQSLADLKTGVRLLMLGGTLGAVAWLLLKRRASCHRREAIFQAIQQSLNLHQKQTHHQGSAVTAGTNSLFLKQTVPACSPYQLASVNFLTETPLAAAKEQHQLQTPNTACKVSWGGVAAPLLARGAVAAPQAPSAYMTAAASTSAVAAAPEGSQQFVPSQHKTSQQEHMPHCHVHGAQAGFYMPAHATLPLPSCNMHALESADPGQMQQLPTRAAVHTAADLLHLTSTQQQQQVSQCHQHNFNRQHQDILCCSVNQQTPLGVAGVWGTQGVNTLNHAGLAPDVLAAAAAAQDDGCLSATGKRCRGNAKSSAAVDPAVKVVRKAGRKRAAAAADLETILPGMQSAHEGVKAAAGGRSKRKK